MGLQVVGEPNGGIGEGGVAACQKFDGFTGGEYAGAVGTATCQLFGSDGQGDPPLGTGFEVNPPEGDQFAVGRGVTATGVAPPEVNLRDLVASAFADVLQGEAES